MFGMVDAFHFNSRNTMEIYNKFLNIPNPSSVVSITHSDVCDYRHLREFDDSVLRLGFIGSEAPYKGLPLLKRVLCKLNDKGYKQNLRLYVYGGQTGSDRNCENISYNGRFSSSQMATVYEMMDLLIVPSICYETFGFTTIEALQYGVPVLVSNKVGSKDIVQRYSSKFVFGTEDELYDILEELLHDKSLLVEYNKKIVESPWNYSMANHSKEMVEFYRRSMK